MWRCRFIILALNEIDKRVVVNDDIDVKVASISFLFLCERLHVICVQEKSTLVQCAWSGNKEKLSRFYFMLFLLLFFLVFVFIIYWVCLWVCAYVAVEHIYEYVFVLG